MQAFSQVTCWDEKALLEICLLFDNLLISMEKLTHLCFTVLELNVLGENKDLLYPILIYKLCINKICLKPNVYIKVK